jgi:hypothetical protein
MRSASVVRRKITIPRTSAPTVAIMARMRRMARKVLMDGM